ncbi:autophagy protein 12-like [Bacillus rossius redtenbacheri]|uniref:autophagy protein 12-like n=1 Tax=Bacillus rossius redtenbacheri TaxID=93214 RepID=UPI002FDDC2FB
MSEGSEIKSDHPEANEIANEGDIHGDLATVDNSHSKADKHKVDILLKATGNAPIMKKKKWSVDSDKRIGWIIEFVRKYLKLDPAESLFLYVNQAFAPAPDQVVRNLYDCYGTDGKLVLHYCKSQAWG